MKKYQKGLPANAMHRQLQAGQILLIVVLVMTVALTVGLSVATRTITNIRTSAEEESSQRAFSAAEAGIERALQNSTGSSGTFTNNTSFQTSVSTLSGLEFLLNNGTPVLKDDAVDVWLSTYPNYTNPWSGDVTVYWGSSSDVCSTSETGNSRAALEILLITGTRANPRLTHFPVDPCQQRATQGATANRFEFISPGGRAFGGVTLAYRKTIAVNSGLLMRIMPLYAPTRVGVRGCNALNGNCNVLPAQGTVVTSVGTSDTTQRKIVGFRENPKLPVQFFPFILFSPN